MTNAYFVSHPHTHFKESLECKLLDKPSVETGVGSQPPLNPITALTQFPTPAYYVYMTKTLAIRREM